MIMLFIGELSLDGEVEAVTVCFLCFLRQERIVSDQFLFLTKIKPKQALLMELIFFPVKNIYEILRHLSNESAVSPCYRGVEYPNTEDEMLDFEDVKGQKTQSVLLKLQQQAVITAL